MLALATLSILVTRSLLPSNETPASALDGFAGRTVKDPQMGLSLMRFRAENYPKVGEMAPDFELSAKEGESTLRLSELRGSKPVVLVFGSYT